VLQYVCNINFAKLERRDIMPKRLETRIWLSGKSYLFSDVEENDELTRKLKPDTPEYYAWLSGLQSFHFEGNEGRFTARRETRKNKGGEIREATYWSAYRRYNHKQLRRYIGTTDKLSVATLEDTARHFTDVCHSLPPKVKTPRKKPEKRETLYARIAIRDRTIAERDKTIEDLQAQIAKQEQVIRDLKKQIKMYEVASQTKKERLEL